MSLFEPTQTGLFTFTRMSALRDSFGIFDPHGDLRLVVGEEKAESLVCSRSLARASPIFNKMLFGFFYESKPAKGDRRVELPEDDPYALCFLLNIIHGRFDRVSSSLTAEHGEEDVYRVQSHSPE
jgi:hypothetical protein